ncbi:hypothetical protein C8Q79DRAFT_930038 [Trametes meyenii]|nr:hypothetical protein C8Q79DRAFT_930038 [Trametes meyenii]
MYYDFTREDVKPRNPPEIELAIDDPDVVLSIEIYLALKRRYPANKLLTYSKVKRTIEKLTGIYSIRHDMCINSCVGFAGPRATLDRCPIPECGQPRYCPTRLKEGKVGRQHFTLPTMLLGPQLQALHRAPESAQRMMYFYEKPSGMSLPSFTDFYSGSLVLQAVKKGTIGPATVLLSRFMMQIKRR